MLKPQLLPASKCATTHNEAPRGPQPSSADPQITPLERLVIPASGIPVRARPGLRTGLDECSPGRRRRTPERDRRRLGKSLRDPGPTSHRLRGKSMRQDDGIWEQIVSTAEELNFRWAKRAEKVGLVVRITPIDKLFYRKWMVLQGLAANIGSRSPHPPDDLVAGQRVIRCVVRERRPFSREWRAIQTVRAAANELEAFLGKVMNGSGEQV